MNNDGHLPKSWQKNTGIFTYFTNGELLSSLVEPKQRCLKPATGQLAWQHA